MKMLATIAPNDRGPVSGMFSSEPVAMPVINCEAAAVATNNARTKTCSG